MSNIIVTIFVIALILVAVLTWSQASFGSMDSGAQAWKQMTETATEVSRTCIDVVNVNTGGTFIDVYAKNCGEVCLSQFSNWDVLVQYYDGNSTYHVESLTYTANATPLDNQWTVASIYADESLSQQEVFEPGLLSPGEVMQTKLKLNPLPGVGTTNRVKLSTPNGVVASAQFAG